MTSLDEFVADLLPKIPTAENNEIVLNPLNCPRPLAELETDRLKAMAWPLGHSYGDSARYDTVHFFADKQTYRALGLLLFSAVFHPNSRSTLQLHHQEATVKQIVIECSISSPENPMPSELVLLPAAYGYWPDIPEDRHPFTPWSRRGHRLSPDELPFMELTNETGGCASEQQFATRKVIRGFGGPEGSAALAALFLDFGLPETKRIQFDLEGPVGVSEHEYWKR